jgi:hypothetical protein
LPINYPHSVHRWCEFTWLNIMMGKLCEISCVASDRNVRRGSRIRSLQPGHARKLGPEQDGVGGWSRCHSGD